MIILIIFLHFSLFFILNKNQIKKQQKIKNYKKLQISLDTYIFLCYACEEFR